jgi:cytidine deaminase
LAIRSETWNRLAEAALAARQRAHAPYSRFAVGAALLVDSPATDEQIVVGCNVENSSYGATICAERAAVCSALVRGHRRFLALAIATEGPEPGPPCGLCLQVLVEFCDELPILLVAPGGARRRTRLSRLISRPFRLEVPRRGSRSARRGKR